jgi:hypothetical protein
MKKMQENYDAKEVYYYPMVGMLVFASIFEVALLS